MVRFLAALLFIVIVSVSSGMVWLTHEVRKAGDSPADTLVYIPPQTSVNGIAALLKEKGLIGNELAFRLYVRATASTLKAGEYDVPAHISIRDIVNIIHVGKTHQRQITFAEGLTSAEILELITAEAALTGDTTTVTEGSLLPETYNFTYGEARAEILTRAQKSMRRELAKLWAERDPATLLKTPEEALVLASIVEKETGIAPERARIAGVFLNRLKKGMPLQSDPTVIYATGGDKKITVSDLKAQSPYNTYVSSGLPPGPICNPGLDAIRAVLHPENHNFLYFVADGTGGHIFAASLKEHQRNVAKWRIIERKAKQSQ